MRDHDINHSPSWNFFFLIMCSLCLWAYYVSSKKIHFLLFKGVVLY